jgi:oligosaccharyltransferase complex subunit gamma
MAVPPPTQVVLFLKTGQSQLGAEGFIMGALYTTVGLCLALLTHGAPYIPHKQAQMGVSFMILLVTVLCYLNIRSTYQWKTGEEDVVHQIELSRSCAIAVFGPASA